MAEITKRKIASIYSLIAGFFLSIFSGHAHAGAFNYTKPQPVAGQRTLTNKTPTQIITPSSNELSPAPNTTYKTSSIITPTGNELSPAPLSTTFSSDIINATEISDTNMKAFVVERAVEQGKTPEQLSSQDFNTLRTDYLLQQVQILQQQLKQLNEQNLSH